MRLPRLRMLMICLLAGAFFCATLGYHSPAFAEDDDSSSYEDSSSDDSSDDSSSDDSSYDDSSDEGSYDEGGGSED